MNRKVLFSLMVCGLVCVSFISKSFAQTVPTPPVTNTEKPMDAKMDKVSDAKTGDAGTIKPKKHHSKTAKKGTGKKTGTKKKAHKKPADDKDVAAAPAAEPKVNN